MTRTMRLTERHVALLRREMADPGPQLIEGFRPATDGDYAAIVAEMLRTRPEGPFWLFGYGSLIWKPETAFEVAEQAVARGWHRRFCLGWDYRYRGCKETPGLMLALDRGGQCRGMIYRLPEDGLEAELHKLIRREMSMVPSAFPWRFIDVVAADGVKRALTFAMNRKSGRYVAGLSDEQLADVLATAVGFRGSMAEYVYSTTAKLEELGIHDKNLWRMQALVAERIEAAYPADREV
jgi:glutathione-specific gamma-glutamylcyclotransferase